MVEYALANGSAASLNYDSNNEVAIADALDFIAKAQTAYHNSDITLTGGLTAKSINANLSGSTVTLSGAEIKGHHTVTGNPTLTGNPHFTGDVYFYGGAVGDSLTYDYAKVHMEQASLNASSIKADLDHATVTLSGAEIKGNPTISGNPRYTGQPHFNGKVYFHTSETEDDETVTDGAKIYMQDSTVQAARCSIAGNPTISGNPRFTGNPHFDGDIYLNRTVDGAGYAKVYADNATIYGNSIFNGNPTLRGNPVFTGNPTLSGNPVFTDTPAFEFISGYLYFNDLNGKTYRIHCTETLDFHRLSFMGYVTESDISRDNEGNIVTYNSDFYFYDSLEDIDVTTPRYFSYDSKWQAGMCIALVSGENSGYYRWGDSEGWVYEGATTDNSVIVGPFTSLEDSQIDRYADSNFSGVIWIQDNSGSDYNINFYIYAPKNKIDYMNSCTCNLRPFTKPKFDPRTLPRFNIIGKCYQISSLTNPRVLMKDGYVTATVGTVVFMTIQTQCAGVYDCYYFWTGANWELFNAFESN